MRLEEQKTLADVQDRHDEARHEKWAHCHINWTAVWVGALTTFSLILVFSLLRVVFGPLLVGREDRILAIRQIGVGSVAYFVCAAFFSAVAGGWSAGKIAGILHSEPAAIHGAITWIIVVPLLLAAVGFGVAGMAGGWYAGLRPESAASRASFAHPDMPPSATSEEISAYRTQLADYRTKVQQWEEDAPKAARMAAIVSLTSLLFGLLGSVIGAWMSCGEPMNFTYYRTRKPIYR